MSLTAARSSATTIAAGAAALLACAEPCPAELTGPVPAAPGPDRGPNVLVVIADDLGVDALAPWGTWSAGAETPVIDRLAAQGVLFERAWSNPVCSPSRASLLTGRHSLHTGVPDVVQPITGSGGLALEATTLAELLRAAPTPRTTALMGKWHLGTPDLGGPRHAGLQGFDVVRGTQGNLLDQQASDGRPQSYWSWEKNTDGVLARTRCYATESVLREALGFIDQAPEPWLLVTAFHAAHEPLHHPPGAPADGDPYLQLVRSLDTALGRLLDTVHPEVLARTWIVFVGDNGPDAETSPRPTAVAKGSVYEVGVHVPMLIVGPGIEPARVGAPVHLVDVLPTLTAITGAETPADVDGTSLLPWLRGEAPADRVVYTDLHGASELQAVRDRRYKLVRKASGADVVDELYDLGEAWVEGQDLLAPPASAEAQAAYARLVAELASVVGP